MRDTKPYTLVKDGQPISRLYLQSPDHLQAWIDKGFEVVEGHLPLPGEDEDS